MIQPVFNAVITFLLANFMLNELPHAVGLIGNPDGEPPTPRQLRYIAVLCQQLKITVHYEEQVRTGGEAGRLIRELEEEKRHRGQLGSRSPIIYVDTNEEVLQGRVQGVAVAWVGSKDVGTLHYELIINGTGEIGLVYVDLEYRGLGVGRKMYLAVESLAKEYGIREINLEVGPIGVGWSMEASRSFWRSLGFTLEDDFATKKLPANPPAQYGTCYEDAWRFLIKEEEGFLIHGSVQLSGEAPRISHAWVELPSGHIFEPQTGQYFTIEDFKAAGPIEEHRYTVEEAAIMLVRVGKYGPWSDEERSIWLRR